MPPGIKPTPPRPSQWDNLLGTSPEHESAASVADAVAADLLERLERMETRLEQIETRLNESNAKEDLDRAAAAAAARILREELATLLAEKAE